MAIIITLINIVTKTPERTSGGAAGTKASTGFMTKFLQIHFHSLAEGVKLQSN
jgi:hypothetical protein